MVEDYKMRRFQRVMKKRLTGVKQIGMRLTGNPLRLSQAWRSYLVFE